MVSEASNVEQAVSRALRDNLAKLQQTTEELNQAVADLVAACSSSKPTNALPPMVRAQTCAASLAASLEVLARFTTAALQPAHRTPLEQEVVRLVSLPAPEPSPAPAPMPPLPFTPVPMGEPPSTAPGVVIAEPQAATAEPVAAAHAETMGVEAPPPVVAVAPAESVAGVAEPPAELTAAGFAEAPGEVPPEAPLEAPAEAVTGPQDEAATEAALFDVATLRPEEQELHRRANRVAKVSMQDIKMLRPEAVRLGREHKDICVRLRDEIEKAHKEYQRRFRTIQDHPVDYFYNWMVEILGGGDPVALGEYPYPSPVLRR